MQRTAKVIAALCAVSVVLLSVFGFIVGSSMGGHPLQEPDLFAALIVVPIFAVTGSVWATLNENRTPAASMVTYIAVAAAPIAWYALTRV